jgi:hypothetical protein
MPDLMPKIKPDPGPSDSELFAAFEKSLHAMTARVRAGLNNLSDFTFMLNLEGHPMSMSRFGMFEEMFDVMPVHRELWLTARQVAKTYSGAAAGIIERLARAGSRSLIVAPLFSQAARISKEVTAPLITNSMFRDELITLPSRQKVLQRTFTNGSTETYSYALLDVLRIRGISGIDRLWVDEIQGVREDLLPVIEQTQAARPYTGWKRYTGTPLSTGNLAEVLWQRSSQGEQVIKCESCNHWNIGSIDHDLLKMIGPLGPICVRCGKAIDVLKQVFVPRYPDREEEFRGRHISQVLHWLHACIPSQWKKLRANITGTSMPIYQLYNEIFGVSYDSADRMMDLPSLKQVCVLGPNTMAEAKKKKKELSICAMGVDYGGGGDTHSWTKIVFGGLKSGSSELHIHYMVELPQSMPPAAQAAELLKMVSMYGPSVFAHDYTGMGWLFETLGFGTSLDPNIIYPFTYGYSPNREVIYSNVGEKGSRASLHLDHTRSLFAMFTAIKAGKIKLPDYDLQRNPDNGTRPVDDLLAVFAERKPSVRGGDVLTIKKDSGHSDDFAHAINFLASACWYRAGSYPAMPETTNNGTRLRLSPEETEQMNGDWMNNSEDDDSGVA